jgi:hypothetical protein
MGLAVVVTPTCGAGDALVTPTCVTERNTGALQHKYRYAPTEMSSFLAHFSLSLSLSLTLSLSLSLSLSRFLLSSLFNLSNAHKTKPNAKTTQIHVKKMSNNAKLRIHLP